MSHPSQLAYPTKRLEMNAERIGWHRAQFAEPKRSTIKLAEFVQRVMAPGEAPAEVLDVATGAGANMKHLAALFPDAKWTGIDLEADLVEEGRRHLDPGRFTLVEGNLFNLEEILGGKRFDVSFSIQTLFVVADYERPIEQMLAVTKDWLFILSLFSDSDLDAFIQLVGRGPGHSNGLQVPYNVYSLPRFCEFCKQLGVREIIAEPFEIDIDLQRPDHKGIGTWTRQTVDGDRLQFSGPLLMPWWFVAVKI
jgi:hypothetical protein